MEVVVDIHDMAEVPVGLPGRLGVKRRPPVEGRPDHATRSEPARRAPFPHRFTAHLESSLPYPLFRGLRCGAVASHGKQP